MIIEVGSESHFVRVRNRVAFCYGDHCRNCILAEYKDDNEATKALLSVVRNGVVDLPDPIKTKQIRIAPFNGPGRRSETLKQILTYWK